MTIDELMRRLSEIREIHGNLTVLGELAEDPISHVTALGVDGEDVKPGEQAVEVYLS